MDKQKYKNDILSFVLKHIWGDQRFNVSEGYIISNGQPCIPHLIKDCNGKDYVYLIPIDHFKLRLLRRKSI